MPQHRDRLEELLQKWTEGQATREDRQALLSLLETLPASEPRLTAFLEQLCHTNTYSNDYTPEQRTALAARILEQYPPEQKPVVKLSVRRWLMPAAAAVLLLAIGAWYFIQSRNLAPATPQPVVQQDIAPGGNRAVLTLGDGRKILLDSAANGQIASEGGTEVVKLENGQISYQFSKQPAGEVVFNTIATPRGGQYQITLPDKTKVWLNASSSVSFPTAFSGATRPVKITGEVYFEVAENKQQPFVVDVDGRASIEVLGTHFNINAYKNEKDINTTLLEGVVRIRAFNRWQILKPGQQTQVRPNGETRLVSNPDIAKIMAWKNGIFNFEDASLQDVMRQLERWYDIDVKYVGEPPNLTFGGELSRDITLSQVIEALREMNVRFKIEGRTLLVMPKE
jgi:Fe2+-dicitrate sensor, membrane component